VVGSLVFRIRACCPQGQASLPGECLVLLQSKDKVPTSSQERAQPGLHLSGPCPPGKAIRESMKEAGGRVHAPGFSSVLGGDMAKFCLFPGPSALPVLAVLPLHPMHVEHCCRFCFTVPRDCSAPILQPSRTEMLIKLFKNPIKMLYESVCHWQRFREEN